MKDTEKKKRIAEFMYLIRIYRLPLEEFGKGMTKNNPIKVRSRRR